MQAPGDGEQKASDDKLRVDVTRGEGVRNVGLVHRESTHDESRTRCNRVERGWNRLSEAKHIGRRVVGRGSHAGDRRSDAAGRGGDAGGPADSTHLGRRCHRTQGGADGGGDESHGARVGMWGGWA